MRPVTPDVRKEKRRRRTPDRFYSDSAAEQRLLQKAIANSKTEWERPATMDVRRGPVFYPTVKDFEGSPIKYIERIRHIAEPYGICKIVPPRGWNPPYCVDADSPKKIETTEQLIHRLQEGISFGTGQDYTIKEYMRKASERAKEWKATHYTDSGDLNLQTHKAKRKINCRRFTAENLEQDYWDIVETHSREVCVEYGKDVDTQEFGSGFPLSERGRSMAAKDDKVQHKVKQCEPKFGTGEYYKETWWNVNNLPSAPDSALRHIKVTPSGVNVPWMYYGSLFATFCWHNEDNYMHSIFYLHKGAPKVWYGVPGTKEAADGLENVFKNYLSMKMCDVPDLLHHITTMFSPRLLQNADVPVCKLLQHPGEFVVTFPRAFHAGFSLGPNVGESVNFCPYDWIPHGSEAVERYRKVARPSVFSHHRLVYCMANHVAEQESYATCKVLLDELGTIVEEEVRLRRQLKRDGVRDLQDQITLPKKDFDKLDENGAAYDDMRLCHKCKHSCFFSAVACPCSQSRVSCLRHGQSMCKCPADRKYFMTWITDQELKLCLQRVAKHCMSLKTPRDDKGAVTDFGGQTSNASLKMIAPGVTRDLYLHRYDDIPTEV